jgi:uncharacterized RDD family membrane protein YckC
MEHSNYALVLTGSVLPGFAPETVWPALATYFRMAPDKLEGQVLARAPLTIKQGDDLGKLQTLQAGIAAIGAEAELCAPDGRPGLFVLLDRAARGPVPRVFVDERVEHGLWAATLSVAEVGTNAWRPYRELNPPPAPVAAPVVEEAAPAPVEEPVQWVAPTPAVEPAPVDTGMLPPGAAIHAGFWRRCAAMMIDGLLIGVAMGVLQVALGIGTAGALAGQQLGAALGMVALFTLAAFVGQWLYFALFESAAMQATPGKRALGLKVVDDGGHRIGFGRASGRYFGKIVSGLILNIGYLLAGWTARKQALHDLMAGTLVVFRSVEPGQALPTERPPMPWYGWLVNLVLVGACLLGVLAFSMFAASLGQLAVGSLPNTF